jgi:hypothetical protein
MLSHHLKISMSGYCHKRQHDDGRAVHSRLIAIKGEHGGADTQTMPRGTGEAGRSTDGVWAEARSGRWAGATRAPRERGPGGGGEEEEEEGQRARGVGRGCCCAGGAAADQPTDATRGEARRVGGGRCYDGGGRGDDIGKHVGHGYGALK